MTQWKNVGFVAVCREVSCAKMSQKVDLSGPKPKGWMSAHTTLTKAVPFPFFMDSCFKTVSYFLKQQSYDAWNDLMRFCVWNYY